MVVVPFPTAVTCPFSSTVATVSLLEVQITDLSVASVDDTVAVK